MQNNMASSFNRRQNGMPVLILCRSEAVERQPGRSGRQSTLLQECVVAACPPSGYRLDGCRQANCRCGVAGGQKGKPAWRRSSSSTRMLPSVSCCVTAGGAVISGRMSFTASCFLP